MGADIGNKQAAAGAQQANALLSGGMGAANANLAGGLSQANMYQNLGKTIGGLDYSSLNSSSPTSFGDFGSSIWSNNINAGAQARMKRQG